VSDRNDYVMTGNYLVNINIVLKVNIHYCIFATNVVHQTCQYNQTILYQ